MNIASSDRPQLRAFVVALVAPLDHKNSHRNPVSVHTLLHCPVRRHPTTFPLLGTTRPPHLPPLHTHPR